MLGNPQSEPETHRPPVRRPVATELSDRHVFLPVASDRPVERMIEKEPLSRPAASEAKPKPRKISDADVAQFLDEVIGSSDSAAPDFVRRLLDAGVTVEAVFLDLLGPTARDLGIRWEDDECSFVDVTVALGRLQRVLRELSQAFQADAREAPDSAGHVLLTCLPGEQHTLGLILVAEFLMRDGFRVLVGAPWSESDLLTQVRSEWFDVIGFSAGCDSRLSTLKREIVRIREVSRNPNVKFLVGGQVFSLDEGLVDRVGADGWARDAKQAPVMARKLLDSRSDSAVAAPSAAYTNAGQAREAVRPG
jgi:MerR family transcriptional regulator, light-induced transcriptional regulator